LITAKLIDTNNLEAMHNIAWELMTLGKESHNSNMHQIYIATVCKNGIPNNRTVILRTVNEETKTLTFNTDSRSGKVKDIKTKPQVAVLLYDHQNRVQLRLQCIASLHYKDVTANNAWQLARLQSQLSYGSAWPSGTIISQPTLLNVKEINVPETHIKFCQENFMVVSLKIQNMDMVFLHHTANKRMKVNYNNDGMEMNWIEI
jgi:pyridoxamine 5'-phosphate oxidase